MKVEPLTEAQLREFLLGKLNEGDVERVECLFLTDSQSRERVLIAEQELMDDYLEDSLTAEDRERFVSRYEQTSTQRRKLSIAKAIKERASVESITTKPLATRPSSWRKYGTRLRLEPRFIIPIAMVVMIAIIVAAVLLNRRPEDGTKKEQAIREELAELNLPANLRQVPLQMVSVDLLPVTTRSGQQQLEVKTNSQLRIVQFHLTLSQKQRYSTYQTEVRRLDSGDSFVISNLQEQSDGTYVRVRLPMYILRRGQYQIELNGFTESGSLAPVEEYLFSVVE